MSKRKKLKKKSTIFIQDWGTYQNETLVVVGKTAKETIRWCKKIKVNKKFLEWLENNLEKHEVHSKERNDPAFFMFGETNSVLFLEPYKDSWNYWETLIHETMHMVDYVLSALRLMEKETEARAYQQEYLFHSIRKKLQSL